MLSQIERSCVWFGAGLVLALVLGSVVLGCGPHDAKHYRTRGQAAQHFPDCRPKCDARTAADWHERRGKP